MSRVFDDAFKIMAVELSQTKGSVVETAKELGISKSSLTGWRGDPRYNGGQVLLDKPGLSEAEQELRRLRKQLKDAELDRDILKKAVAIFSKSDGKYTDL